MTSRSRSRLSARLSASLVAGLVALSAGACVEEVQLTVEPPSTAMRVSETRSVELRFLRVDVKEFSQTLSLEDIRGFPRDILDNTWLLDLDAAPLVYNALEVLQRKPPIEAYAMPPAALNMWKLLTMTPDNVVLDGTSLAPLLGIGKAVGLAPSRILGDLLSIDANAPAIPTELAAEAVLENVIGSHPNAQWRRGLKTAENPAGLYPVTPGAIPVYLADVVDDFMGLPVTFGPAPADPNDPEAPVHPGFITATSGLRAALSDFAMTVKVNLNASPYKGVDLTNSTIGSVNSTASQITTAFDLNDPEWLSLDGLVSELVIPELTMTIYENPEFLPGGTSREPAAQGDSPAWDLPPWEFERLILDLARLRSAEIPGQCTLYGPEGEVEEPFAAVSVCIDDQSWVEISVDESVVGLEAPTPSYFWDVLLEVAQVRLHDSGLAEGAADVVLKLYDVPVGVTTEMLVAAIKANLAADPAPLTDIAELINDNADGDPDFYYYQPSRDNPPEIQGDYLYFVAPIDIRVDGDNLPVRAYSDYANPGFFADPELREKVSDRREIDDDTVHEKVQVFPGDTLYVEDEQGWVYRLRVGDKPTPNRVALDITRVR